MSSAALKRRRKLQAPENCQASNSNVQIAIGIIACFNKADEEPCFIAYVLLNKIGVGEAN
jgi:hypothetical protein